MTDNILQQETLCNLTTGEFSQFSPSLRHLRCKSTRKPFSPMDSLPIISQWKRNRPIWTKSTAPFHKGIESMKTTILTFVLLTVVLTGVWAQSYNWNTIGGQAGVI